MVIRLAARLRRAGFDLNWVFDPLGAMRFAVQRKACPEHSEGAERSPRVK